jgi:hypothetical protein
MFPRTNELGWAFLGNLVVGAGAGTATYAAFQQALPLLGRQPLAVRVAVVSVGFALFFAGYRISQAGIHKTSDESLVTAFQPAVENGDTSAGFAVLRGGFVVVGVVGLALGMTLFAQTIITRSLSMGFLAGAVSIGGYIFGHIGMNATLL